MTDLVRKRYLFGSIDEDLAEKMVFVSGPRQVGKTTLALQLVGAPDARHPAYLSWDDVGARSRIRRGEMPPDQARVVLDEVHKYARWRGLVKGLWDTREPGRSFLITGSARLDAYRRGGDSLHGRYHPYLQVGTGRFAGMGVSLSRWGYPKEVGAGTSTPGSRGAQGPGIIQFMVAEYTGRSSRVRPAAVSAESVTSGVTFQVARSRGR